MPSLARSGATPGAGRPAQLDRDSDARRMRGVRLAVALTAALFAAAAPARAADWHDWSGTSGDLAGHGSVSRGDAIWSDYLYDDYGANVDGFNSMSPDVLIGALSPHAY